MNLGYTDNEVLKWFYKGLCEVNREHSVTEWIELIMEFEKEFGISIPDEKSEGIQTVGDAIKFIEEAKA
mgnify:CR=1 FL=1